METGNHEFLPKQESRPNLPAWRSHYNPVVLKTFEKLMQRKIKNPKEVASKKDKLKSYLDRIDDQLVDNFGVFQSVNNPGVKFPFTRISVNELVGDREKDSQRKKITYVVFTPFSQPPGGDPADPINTIYDRALISLPEVADTEAHASKNIDILVLGMPTSKWGSVSEKWLEDLKANGFSQHGKLFAEFLKTVLDNNPKNSIIFRADSMGAILANETALQLPEFNDRLRLMLDVPTGVHKPSSFPLSPKGVQVVLGFGAELFVRFLSESLVRNSLLGVKASRESLALTLSQKGIQTNETEDQNSKKKAAFKQEFVMLMRGTPLDTDSFRSYITQGLLDPATVSVGSIISSIKSLWHSKNERFYKAGNRALGMGLNYSHWIDRGRWSDKWIRQIEKYEQLSKKS